MLKWCPNLVRKEAHPPTLLEWLVSEARGPRGFKYVTCNRFPPDVPRGEAYPQESPKSSHLTKHAARLRDERKSRELVKREIHDEHRHPRVTLGLPTEQALLRRNI